MLWSHNDESWRHRSCRKRYRKEHLNGKTIVFYRLLLQLRNDELYFQRNGNANRVDVALFEDRYLHLNHRCFVPDPVNDDFRFPGLLSYSAGAGNIRNDAVQHVCLLTSTN